MYILYIYGSVFFCRAHSVVYAGSGTWASYTPESYRTIPSIHTPENPKRVQELPTLQACLKALAKSMQLGPVLRATQEIVCPQAVFYSYWRFQKRAGSPELLGCFVCLSQVRFRCCVKGWTCALGFGMCTDAPARVEKLTKKA